jgi:uncharacterized protein (DUF169 family)
VGVRALEDQEEVILPGAARWLLVNHPVIVMKSITAEKAGLAYEPVAILWSDTKPAGALQIRPGARTCIMPFFAQVVTRNKTAVFDRETYGCPGARAGLGFGSGYPDAFAGAGVDFMAAFFTKGLASCDNRDAYCAVVSRIPGRERAKFIHGERLHRNTEKAKRWMTEELPVTDIRERYVIFTPLRNVPDGGRPVVVVFVADPLQITALITLVGAVRDGTDPVRVPPMAACQQIGAYVYDEATKEHPRAVLGYTDLAARANVGKSIPAQMFTFAVPFSLFLEMEEEAQDGVFDGPIWQELVSGT